MLRHGLARNLRYVTTMTTRPSVASSGRWFSTEETKDVVETSIIPESEEKNIRIEVGRMQVKGSTKKNNRLAQFVRSFFLTRFVSLSIILTTTILLFLTPDSRYVCRRCIGSIIFHKKKET